MIGDVVANSGDSALEELNRSVTDSWASLQKTAECARSAGLSDHADAILHLGWNMLSGISEVGITSANQTDILTAHPEADRD